MLLQLGAEGRFPDSWDTHRDYQSYILLEVSSAIYFYRFYDLLIIV